MKGSKSKLDYSTSNAGNLMRKLVGEQGGFAFCVRADTGHILIGYTDESYAQLYSDNEVAESDEIHWTEGVVLDRLTVRYTRLGQFKWMSPNRVFQRSNTLLKAAGLDPRMNYLMPNLIIADPHQRGTMVLRGLTPNLSQIPISSGSKLDIVWEDGYAYTKWKIIALQRFGKTGTLLSHDRFILPLAETTGSFQVFNSFERGRRGDKGYFVEANYENLSEKSLKEPQFKVSAGDSQNNGYMITRAKAPYGHNPSIFTKIQVKFQKRIPHQGD